jgi:hypothetical protein
MKDWGGKREERDVEERQDMVWTVVDVSVHCSL